MNSKKTVISAFILVVLIQWYIPVKMIWDSEEVLDKGVVYKFLTDPVDPSDPFRGKFITLRYRENSVKVPVGQNWEEGETIYVLLTTDSDGFAKIESVAKEKPALNREFVKAKVLFFAKGGSNKVFIDYPFTRFYMEESKAPDAELLYNRSQRDTTQITYALVRVKDGNALLEDVLIDGVPIGEAVERTQKNPIYE